MLSKFDNILVIIKNCRTAMLLYLPTDEQYLPLPCYTGPGNVPPAIFAQYLYFVNEQRNKIVLFLLQMKSYDSHKIRGKAF